MQPYGTFFFAMLMVVLSPIQYFVQGILHVDYGFKIMNRIFGEYQFNTIKTVTTQDLISVTLSATFDAVMFNIFYYVRFFNIEKKKFWWNFMLQSDSGKTASQQSLVVFNSVLLAMMLYWRNRSIVNETYMLGMFNIFALLVTLTFVLEDPMLAGVEFFVQSPCYIAMIVFMWLMLFLKGFSKLVWQHLVSSKKSTLMTYQTIEDRLLYEEYEDPKQQFSITEFDQYREIAKIVEDTKLFAIN